MNTATQTTPRAPAATGKGATTRTDPRPVIVKDPNWTERCCGNDF